MSKAEESTDQEALAALKRKKAVVSTLLGLFLGLVSVVVGIADSAAL